ncbi:MAG: tRNA pseudouridine(38-40) synthase TruA [Candidatus Omnitrophica bacterium]|nr:tRNA pseudouridine(38-40) synthase TruA [Candidatus Omnitrophota bacterium]
MRNIKLTIEYNGTNFSGWQRQKRRSYTIQQVIEETLQKMLHQEIKLIASGRTDSGVHAKAQTANFKTASHIPLERLQEGLNALLPKDIAVIGIAEASGDFHSRYCAKSKAYRYTILNRTHRSALLKDSAYFCRYPLDLKLMQNEADSILGKHDFSAFKASGKEGKNPVKTVKKLKVSRKGDLVYVDIEADGFLYNMVRNIAGTLIDIGRGKLGSGSLKKILDSKDRRKAGHTAPACGLCLLKVKY